MPKQQKPFLDPIFARAEVIRQEIDRRECAKSCRRFIKRHVKIEDPDTPGIVIPFLLWIGQLIVLRVFLYCRFVLILKARQLGLTWLALAYALWRMIFTPGYTVAAISTTEDKAKELVSRLEFILRHLPPHIIRPKKGCDPRWRGPTWESTTETITIHHYSEEDAAFQALTASPDAARSLVCSLLIMDECAFHEAAEDIWSAALPIINRMTGGQVLMISTMKLGSLFHKHCIEAKEGRSPFRYLFLNRWADPRRDQAWWERTQQLLPNKCKREYPETFEEACSVGEGAFFLEWQESIHVVDHWVSPRSAAWPVIGVYDPAYNQACFKWYTVSPGVPGFPHGWARCFREYAPVHVTAYDQAREIVRLSCYRDGKAVTIKDPYPDAQHKTIEVPGSPYVFRYIVGDTRAWVKGDDSGISTAEIFANYGLFMRQATKGLEAGWMELHEWLKPVPDLDAPPNPNRKQPLTAKLTFTRDCGFSLRTYPACEQDKSRPYDISAKTPHDPQDCDMYFVQSRVAVFEPDTSKRAEVESKWGDKPGHEAELHIWRKYAEEEDDRGGVTFDDLGM